MLIKKIHFDDYERSHNDLIDRDHQFIQKLVMMILMIFIATIKILLQSNIIIMINLACDDFSH